MGQKNETAMVKQEAPQQPGALDLSAKVLAMIAGSGDLGQLTLDERAQYIVALCNTMGLNPLSRPIELMEFEDFKGNKKIVPYAKKECTDQLRQLHGISVEIVEKATEGDIYTVVARARDAEGRTDEDMGSVPLTDSYGKPLVGMRLANAHMKALTKAKRRVTLSIAGLGILDESEMDGLENPQPLTVAQRLGVSGALPQLPKGQPSDPVAAVLQEIAQAPDLKALDKIAARISDMPMTSQQRKKVAAAFAARREVLAKGSAIDVTPDAPPQSPAEAPKAAEGPCEECGGKGGEHHPQCPVGEAQRAQAAEEEKTQEIGGAA